MKLKMTLRLCGRERGNGVSSTASGQHVFCLRRLDHSETYIHALGLELRRRGIASQSHPPKRTAEKWNNMGSHSTHCGLIGTRLTRLLSKSVKLFFHIFFWTSTEYPHRIHRVFPAATMALRGEPRLASEARYLVNRLTGTVDPSTDFSDYPVYRDFWPQLPFADNKSGMCAARTALVLRVVVLR